MSFLLYNATYAHVFPGASGKIGFNGFARFLVRQPSSWANADAFGYASEGKAVILTKEHLLPSLKCDEAELKRLNTYLYNGHPVFSGDGGCVFYSVGFGWIYFPGKSEPVEPYYYYDLTGETVGDGFFKLAGNPLTQHPITPTKAGSFEKDANQTLPKIAFYWPRWEAREEGFLGYYDPIDQASDAKPTWVGCPKYTVSEKAPIPDTSFIQTAKGRLLGDAGSELLAKNGELVLDGYHCKTLPTPERTATFENGADGSFTLSFAEFVEPPETEIGYQIQTELWRGYVEP